MRKSLVLLIVLVGCSNGSPPEPPPRPSLIAAEISPPAPPPEPPPPPKPEFDSKDRKRTALWIQVLAKDLESQYQSGKKAVEENALNDEGMKAYRDKHLPAYKEALKAMGGREVEWTATVDSIDQDGVRVWEYSGYATEEIHPLDNDISTMYVNLYVVGGPEDQHPHGRTKMTLDRHIARDFAKALKKGDVVTLRGVISKVEFVEYPGEPPFSVDIYLDGVSCKPPKVSGTE